MICVRSYISYIATKRSKNHNLIYKPLYALTQILKLYLTEFKYIRLSDLALLMSKLRDDSMPDISPRRGLINLESTKANNYFGYEPVELPMMTTVIHQKLYNKTKHTFSSRNSKDFLSINRTIERKSVPIKPKQLEPMLTMTNINRTDVYKVSQLYGSEIKRIAKRIGSIKKQMLK